MNAIRSGAPQQNRGKIYNEQLKALNELRAAFNETAASSGQFHTQTVRTISDSERLTNAIKNQKIGWGQASAEFRAYKKELRTGVTSNLGEAIRGQEALRNSMSTQWSSKPFGKNSSDMFIPKNLNSNLNDSITRYGMINRLLYSAAQNTVNWGKNTQWAGRQIMVGLTLPLGMAAVGAGALALKIDQELTRVAKVYDTTADTAEGREKELSRVREVGLNQAKRLAQEYGSSMEDVINIQAQLAATGLSGNKLFSSTDEAARIATLGEMDVQESIDMTVSLQTAFRDTIKTAEDLTQTFDFFNSVENATSLAIQDIAEATPRAASAMAALGVDAKEMTVMLVAMKESGVDAAEAANALKSGATRILDPTKEAVQYWDQVLDKDLPAIVKKAGGNMFDFIKEISVALNGLDPQTVQTAIAKTFGTYQFNRITALVGNVGDAMTGTSNQTAKAFELLGQSAETHATGAARELEKLQESVSFRFKAAVESVKAELIPLGMMALEIGTFILEKMIKPLISGFQEMGSFGKGATLAILGLVAIAGPLLMITGIFANLFGNVMKLGLQIGNLRWKFKAMSAEEAAAMINARTASSAFSTEAGAAANLAAQINILTAAMEKNAIANGMMTSAGQKTVNGFTRTVRRVPGTADSFAYAAGSRDDNGKPIAGHSGSRMNPSDVAAFKAVEDSSKKTAGHAEDTRRSMSKTGAIVGALAVGGLAIGAMNEGSESVNEAWINIAMMAAMVATVLPTSVFTGMADSVRKMTGNLKTTGGPGIMGKIKAGFTGIADKARMISSASIAAGGGLKGISAGANAFKSMLPVALRVFGPLGLIAGAAIYFKNMNDNIMEVKDNAIAIGGASEKWAEVQGWDYNPGQLPGMKPEEVKGHQARIDLIDKMSKAQDGLSKAMVAAKQAGTGYEMALDMAMQSLTAGATIEQAREQFQAALDMAGFKETEIDELSVKYDRLHLENPENLREQLLEQINGTTGDVKIEGNLTPSDDAGGGIGGWFKARGGDFMEDLGRDLTAEAEAAATILGTRFGTAFGVAGENKFLQADALNAASAQYDQMFSDMFSKVKNGIKGDDEVSAAFSRLGIKGADSFVSAINTIDQKMKDGKALTSSEKTLWEEYEDNGDMEQLMQTADQYWDNFIDGMVKTKQITADEGNLMKKQLASILDLRKVYDVPATGIISEAKAFQNWKLEVDEAKKAGRGMTDEQKEARRVYWLAAAGLDEGSNAAKKFGNYVGGATAEVEKLNNLASGMMNFNADNVDQLINSQKAAMGGTMNDIFSEADRQFQEMQSRNLESINEAGDARQEAMKADADRVDADFERRQGEAEWYWATRENAFDQEWDTREKGFENEWKSKEKAFEDEWEDRIEAEENYWDSRIEGIEASIEAEEEAEKKRQEIFEAEQRRIDRMASRLSSNIDFNVALNSGDLDEAARVANDAVAQQDSWTLEDQNRISQDASEAKVAKLQEELDQLQTLKEARLEEIKTVKEARLEEMRTVKEARQEALRNDRETAQANLNFQKAIADQRLQSERDAARAGAEARMEADRKDTESTLKSVQVQMDADKRGLAERLRALQEFVPQNEAELIAHTAEVEKVYQGYGLDLRDEGNKWGSFVGAALKTNVDAAAAALQNDINWVQIAEKIAADIGAGMGMTMQQVKDFLRTGVFPAGDPATTTPYAPRPFVGSANAAEHRAGIPYVTKHIGGEIGGPAGSARDRTGVPRGASPYPSEQLVLAKRGEFMVNKKDAMKNKPLLETINSGGNPNDIGGPLGGFMEFTAGLAALQMVSAAKVMQIAATKKVADGKAAYEAQLAAASAGAAGGSTGTIAGGNAPWQRLWNTIKSAFPKAGLNDSTRPGANDYHGKGMAIDIGLAGTPGGAGNSYMADMNRWIYDNFRGSTELIYNGLGDDRSNLKHGQNLPYSAAIQASHRNHVHWAMTPEAIAAAGRKIASGAVGPVSGGGSVRDQVLAAANAKGWGTGANWAAIDWVINKESGWRPEAQNPVSTASGLFQHIDKTWNAYKRPGVAAPKMRLAPVNEQAWAGMNYFGGRYGSPAQARVFWERNGWYDDGGYLQPGVNQVVSNGTRRPEPVFTGPQWDILKANINPTFDVPSNGMPTPVRVVDNVANGGETRYDVTVDLRGAVIKDDIDFQAGVERALDNIENRKGRKRKI